MDIRALGPAAIQQAAELLVLGFAATAPAAWPTLESALAEVQEALAPGRICRVALDEQGTVRGWVAGMPSYDGHVWELHPLVVHPAHQRQGIGRALVQDLEAQVQAAGGYTLWLGTDDEVAATSLGGRDLYPDPLAQLHAIQNLHNHPYSFYQRLGFVIVGVVPDANGFGKPDILMAKRIGVPPA